MTFSTIEQSIRANGDRHLERAISYISAGYPDHYADGSLRKARRNYKRSTNLILDAITEAMLKPLIDQLNQAICDTIMTGSGGVHIFMTDNLLSMENMKHD